MNLFSFSKLLFWSACFILVCLFGETRLKAAPFPVEILVQEARVTNTAPETFESFGHDVELSGDTAAIAARGPALAR